jgi:hypothetical protein
MRNFQLKFGAFALVATLLLGACSAMRGPDDKAITSEIQAKLFQDPVLKTRDVRVVSEKGVVTLTGTVGSELERAAVERLANQATGVKQVVDNLTASLAPVAQSAAPEMAAETPAAAPPKRPRSSSHSPAYSEATAATEQAAPPAPPVAAPAALPAKAAESAAPSPPPPPA